MPLLITVTKQYSGQQVRFLNNNYIFVTILYLSLEKFANCLLIRMERHFSLLLPKNSH